SRPSAGADVEVQALPIRTVNRMGVRAPPGGAAARVLKPMKDVVLSSRQATDGDGPQSALGSTVVGGEEIAVWPEGRMAPGEGRQLRLLLDRSRACVDAVEPTLAVVVEQPSGVGTPGRMAPTLVHPTEPTLLEIVAEQAVPLAGLFTAKVTP